MTMRVSTGLRNAIAKYGAIGGLMSGGRIEIRTGAQPASADAAASGTLLCTITANGAAFTPDTQASGTITITGTSGNITAVGVGSTQVLDTTVPFNTSTTQTAADLAAAINATQSSPRYIASSASNVVTIRAVPGRGTGGNLQAITVSGGITNTTTQLLGGLNGANGLLFSAPDGGVLSKRADQTWQGTNVASGTAGWFRHYGPTTDTGAADAAGTLLRIDGAIGVSAAEMLFNSVAFTSGAVTSLSNWTLEVPAVGS